MSKKKSGLLIAFGAMLGGAVAAGISYYLKLKSFNDELDQDFHEYEEEDSPSDENEEKAENAPERTYITINSGKDAVPGTSSHANGSAGRSTPRRSTREYPGHRKESFPNNRAGSRTNSHKTTTFPIPKPLRPDIHVPCRTLHPSAKSPTPRADYPQKHPAAPAAIRFYPSSNLLLHSPRRAGRRTRPRAGNITTTARQAKCQPRRVE